MKEDVVRELLKRGHLVSPETLERVDMNNIDSIAREKTLVLTETQPENRLSVSVEAPIKITTITPQDFLEHCMRRYETIRDMLLRKTEAVSVNKARKSSAPVTTIGMVREILPSGFVLDDPTGEIDVILTGHNTIPIETGDVVAVRGNVREEKFFAEEIMLPDIPLTNAINRIENTNLFLTTRHSAPPGLKPDDVLVSKHPLKHKHVVSCFPNPAWIAISRGANRITLLVYEPPGETTMEKALLFLKKRYINTEKAVLAKNSDPFLLAAVPDIFWLISKNQWTLPYKGVTIISCKDQDARINLNTRDVAFL